MSFERIKLLIVDDSLQMISIVKAIVRGFGVKDIHDATDADTAFRILQSTPIDIAFIDHQMSPITGCELTKWVRTSPDSSNPLIPIIMLTAYAEKRRVEDARDSGVTEFCSKPVTPKELYRKICAVVNTPRAFVRAGEYSGPDRRRRNEKFAGEDRRAQTGNIFNVW